MIFAILPNNQHIAQLLTLGAFPELFPSKGSSGDETRFDLGRIARSKWPGTVSADQLLSST